MIEPVDQGSRKHARQLLVEMAANNGVHPGSKNILLAAKSVRKPGLKKCLDYLSCFRSYRKSDNSRSQILELKLHRVRGPCGAIMTSCIIMPIHSFICEAEKERRGELESSCSWRPFHERYPPSIAALSEQIIVSHV